LALLIALPTFSVSQWILSYACWFDSRNAHSTVTFYVPWRAILLLGQGTTCISAALLTKILAGTCCRAYWK